MTSKDSESVPGVDPKDVQAELQAMAGPKVAASGPSRSARNGMWRIGSR